MKRNNNSSVLFLQFCFFLMVLPTMAFNPSSSLLYEDDPNICIGGRLCGEITYDIDLAEIYNITSIEVYAHDNVGRIGEAELIVNVGRSKMGRRDVKRGGSWLTFPGKRGQSITFQSVRIGDVTGGDETQIVKVKVYGN